ncbi:hypothetical protein PIB30_083373 [Stylosanthes scabra]|uniref:Putative plant transposon protein domain-containing protein n=1 Tax=Stylosanthes scabra TaxID=79078 RepID=A0ABU6SUJ1_9FABA|nr:hypothetical protein [Stylosanthes scabra]
MEGTYSYDEGYTPWNPLPYQHHAPQYNVYQSNGLDPPPPYPPSQGNFEDIFQVLQQGKKEFWEAQKRLEAQLATVTELVTRLVTPSVASTSITSQPLNSGDLPSQALSIPRRRIPTLFLCANQEGREDALLNEENVENLNHEEVRECLEEVEQKNEDQEAEDVDHEVENKDKEQNGMESVHSASSKATPSKLPSELQFEWVNFSNLNFIGPQHYGLLETDGQLKALCGVLDKKKEDSTELGLEFIIHSMIATGNKSEITVARAVLIHSIIKGHDVRVEELIADNIAFLVEGVQGRSKLCFPSTIYRLCKEARVPMGEFRNSDQIQIARPITAKNQPMEEDEDNYDAENLYTNQEQNQEMHYEAKMHYEAAGAEEDNYQHQEQPNFEAYKSNFQQYKEDQQQRFQFLNEELASMKIRQEQFFENIQNAQSQYLDELKALRTRQDEMVNQQNNFYRQIKRDQEKTIKEIEEVKKFQVNQTLMGARRTPEEKLEERMHEQGMKL